MDGLTVHEALERYLDTVAESRSPLTHRAYRQAADRFRETLERRGITPAAAPISALSAEWLAWYIEELHDYAVATERLYLTAISGFYEHVAAERWADVNLPSLRQLRRRRARREATRLPPFPRDEIERVLETVRQGALAGGDDPQDLLRRRRDCALLHTLADTGLRVAEACSLTRGHLDWNEARAIVLGKGSREGVVRFSSRSLHLLRSYLAARADLDGSQRRPLRALPLFARHDRAAGRRILPLSTRSVEKIVEQWVVAALGPSDAGAITPHTFRHYFVTVALRGSGGNLRLAQELARHRSIATTERYAHVSDDELDRSYYEIFEQDRDG